jgi:hypothetical protein
MACNPVGPRNRHSIVILILGISTKLDKVIEKLERIEWATGELERRVPDWLSRN